MSELSVFVTLRQAHRQGQCGTQCGTLWRKKTCRSGPNFQIPQFSNYRSFKFSNTKIPTFPHSQIPTFSHFQIIALTHYPLFALSQFTDCEPFMYLLNPRKTDKFMIKK